MGEGTVKNAVFVLLAGDYGGWEMNERQTARLVDWLFWLFKTAFQFVSIRLPEKMREKRETIGEGKSR